MREREEGGRRGIEVEQERSRKKDRHAGSGRETLMTFLISSRTGLTEPPRHLPVLYLLVIDGEGEGWGAGARFVLTAPLYHPRVISYTEHAVSPLALFAFQVYAPPYD